MDKTRRKHIANWLSNLSVAVVAIGAFQVIDVFSEYGYKANIAVLLVGLGIFFFSFLLAKGE